MAHKIKNEFRLQRVRADLSAKRMPYSLAAFNTDKETNIGGLIRSCNAFLSEEFIYIGDPVFEKSASVGALRLENLRFFPDLERFFAWLDEVKRPLICIEQHSHAQCLTSFEPPEHSILVLGMELLGTPKELLERAVMKVEIPQVGAVGSLNVATAGAIVLYELSSRYHLGRPPHPAPEFWKPGGRPKRQGDTAGTILKRVEKRREKIVSNPPSSPLPFSRKEKG
jgi:tRNA G18 (ribose-2'-O)-methylase SpoU